MLAYENPTLPQTVSLSHIYKYCYIVIYVRDGNVFDNWLSPWHISHDHIWTTDPPTPDIYKFIQCTCEVGGVWTLTVLTDSVTPEPWYSLAWSNVHKTLAKWLEFEYLSSTRLDVWLTWIQGSSCCRRCKAPSLVEYGTCSCITLQEVSSETELWWKNSTQTVLFCSWHRNVLSAARKSRLRFISKDVAYNLDLLQHFNIYWCRVYWMDFFGSVIFWYAFDFFAYTWNHPLVLGSDLWNKELPILPGLVHMVYSEHYNQSGDHSFYSYWVPCKGKYSSHFLCGCANWFLDHGSFNSQKYKTHQKIHQPA